MRAESSREVRRRAGGGGCSAQLGKRVVLHGLLSHELPKLPLGKKAIVVFGNIELDGQPHDRSKLFELQIRPISGQRPQREILFPFKQVNLKAIKLFRELLSRYLEKIKDLPELPEEIRQNVGEYVLELARYTDAKAQYDQLQGILSKINLENPDDVAKIALALFAFDACPESEQKLEVEG